MGLRDVPRGSLLLPDPPDPQSPLLAAARRRGRRGRMAGRFPTVPGAGHGRGLQPRSRRARRGGGGGEHRGAGAGGPLSNLSLRLYHRLPWPARSLAASLHGWYLRWSRYGRDTPRLVAEAQEREHWIAPQWDSWRQERLAYVLHRAATRVPYYRAQWAARRLQGDHASWEDLET